MWVFFHEFLSFTWKLFNYTVLRRQSLILKLPSVISLSISVQGFFQKLLLWKKTWILSCGSRSSKLYFRNAFTLLVPCWHYPLVVWINQFWCCFCLLSVSSEIVPTRLLSKYYFKLQVWSWLRNFHQTLVQLWFIEPMLRKSVQNALVCSPHTGGSTQSTCCRRQGEPSKIHSCFRTDSALNPHSIISSRFQLSCFALCLSQYMQVLVFQSPVPVLKSNCETPESFTPAVAQLQLCMQWTTLLGLTCFKSNLFH